MQLFRERAAFKQGDQCILYYARNGYLSGTPVEVLQRQYTHRGWRYEIISLDMPPRPAIWVDEADLLGEED